MITIGSRFFIIVLGILSGFFAIGQNPIETYLNKNAVETAALDKKTSPIMERLLAYNFYFYSENHDMPGVGIAKSLLSDYLFQSKNINASFIEYPVYMRNELKSLLQMPPRDTTKYDFLMIYSDDKHEDRYMFRDFYKNFRTNKFDLVPIDILLPEEYSVWDIVQAYPQIKRDKQLKKDFKVLRRLRFTPFRTSQYKINSFLKYRKKVLSHDSIYSKVLKEENYNNFVKSLEGIFICKDCGDQKKEEETIFSEQRESFMFENIINEISKKPQGNYISISGHLHTTSPMNDSCCLFNFETLASRVKKKINSCTIYFMNTKEDDFANTFFKNEKKIISEYVSKKGSSLIYLKDENSPFENMSKNYDFVVAW